MKKIIDAPHNPTERAHMTACAMGIQLNIDCEAYGGTESLRAMFNEDIVFHGTRSETVTYLCGLHKKINSILSLFIADSISRKDKDACLRTLSETCAPKPLCEIYLKWIYGNKSLERFLA